jgi:AcrR family transcriptional regulator
MANIKNTILIEVNKIVHRTGFKSVTFSSIALKVGTTRENIHHHFKTKEKLGLMYISYLEKFLKNYFSEIHQSDLSEIEKLKKYYALYRINTLEYASCPLVSLLNDYANLTPLLQEGIQQLIKIEFTEVKKIINYNKDYTDKEIEAIIMLLKGAVLYEKSNTSHFDDMIIVISEKFLYL